MVLRLLLMIALLPLGVAAQGSPEAAPAGQDPGTLARAAHAVLVKRCARCHGADVAKPKGDFGDVEDLAKLRADWITGTDPEETDLWLCITDPDEPMPPKDQPEYPMPAAELDLLAAWIRAGAPDLPPPPSEGEVETPITDLVPTTADETVGPGIPVITQLLGKAHVLFVHFPVGLLMAAVLAEFLALLKPGDGLKHSTRFCLWVGAAGAAAAALSGWMAVPTEGYGESSVQLHRWLGVGTAGFAWVVVGIAEWSWRADSPKARTIRRLALVALALLLTAAAHGGGELVHGEDHFELLGAR